MNTDLKIKKVRGDTARTYITVKGKNKVVIPLAGWTQFRLTVDTSKTPTDGLSNVSQVNGTLVTDGSDGRVWFPTDGTIAMGNYFFDIQALDSLGDKITIAMGDYKVIQDINKA